MWALKGTFPALQILFRIIDWYLLKMTGKQSGLESDRLKPNPCEHNGFLYYPHCATDVLNIPEN